MSQNFTLLRAFTVAFILATLACSSAKTETTPTTPSVSAEKKSLPQPSENYVATYLDGTKFDSGDFVNRKIVFGFFSFEHKNSLPLLKALEKLKSQENEKQFKIIAVSIDYNKPKELKAFLEAHKISLPVLLESSTLDLATRLNVQNETAVVGLNNKHETAFGIREYVFGNIPNGETQFLDYMKTNLNIKSRKGAEPFLGLQPLAPDFEATSIDGKKIRLSDYRGKAVLVFFFSPKCPHCHHEIKFLKESFYPEMHSHGLEIIALSVLRLEGETLKITENFKMPWPVIDDGSRAIRGLYSAEMSIPENFFIDKAGKVRFVSRGYAPSADLNNLYTMRVKHLLEMQNPPLLSDKRFNGVETCMVCHEAQYASWAVTPHAHAWETLQIKGEDFNPDCAGCHSLGMNNPKGWKPVTDPRNGKQVANVPQTFQNVQCEHCHGIGGSHLSQPLQGEELKKSCLECHTEKFSLHFDFDERLKKVGHANASQILAMSEEERIALLKKASKRPEDLFGSQIAYVGSASCLSCHADTHKNWQKSVHGLSAKKDYSQPGPDQENIHSEKVGASCESCHGPGAKHVASKQRSDIRGLGEDCPFCVIEQICMSCHDARNDPDFNLVKGLETIRGHQ